MSALSKPQSAIGGPRSAAASDRPLDLTPTVPCYVCKESSAVHNFWQLDNTAPHGKKAISKSVLALQAVAVGTLFDGSASVIMSKLQDILQADIHDPEEESRNRANAKNKASTDNFLLAHDDDDDDDDDGDAKNEKQKSGGGQRERTATATAAQKEDGHEDGRAVLQNECFCTVAANELVWPEKIQTKEYDIPKDATAMLLESLTEEWALALHCAHQQLNHLTLAAAVPGGFIDIVATASTKKNADKMLASSSLSSSASHHTDDLYASDSRSNSSKGTSPKGKSPKGSGKDNDDEECQEDEYTLPHILSLQILLFPGGNKQQQRHQGDDAQTGDAHRVPSMLDFARVVSSSDQQTTGLALIFPRLKRLVLRDCVNITDTAIPPIGDLLFLRSLDLSGCTQLTALLGLQELKMLQHLNIRGCTRLAAPDAFLFIANKLCGSLRQLLAADLPQLNDACFVALAQKLQFLSLLDVSGSAITAEAFSLAAKTAMSRSLEVLIARECKSFRDEAAAATEAREGAGIIGEEGGGEEDKDRGSGADDSDKNDTATDNNNDDAGGGDNDDSSTSKQQQQQRQLSLSGDLEGLLSFTKLHTLDLSRNTNLDSGVCVNIGCATALKSVSLDGLKLEERDLIAIGSAPKVTELSLQWCNVNDDGLAVLGGVDDDANAQSSNHHDHHHEGDVVDEGKGGDDDDDDDDDREEAAQKDAGDGAGGVVVATDVVSFAMTQLTSLRLDGNILISSVGVDMLCDLKLLQTLSLYCCRVDDEAGATIRQMPLLVELNVGKSTVTAASSSGSSSTGITDAFVKQILGTAEEAAAAAAEVKGSSSASLSLSALSLSSSPPLKLLRHLNLENSLITGESVNLIAGQECMEVLHLEGTNNIVQVEPLLQLMSSLKKLRFLCLDECVELGKHRLQIYTAAKKKPDLFVKM